MTHSHRGYIARVGNNASDIHPMCQGDSQSPVYVLDSCMCKQPMVQIRLMELCALTLLVLPEGKVSTWIYLGLR